MLEKIDFFVIITMLSKDGDFMGEKYIEEKNGQLSFFKEERVLNNQQESYFVNFIKKGIKIFQSKLDFLNFYKNDYISGKLNFEVKKEFDDFINKFLQMYNELAIEEFLFFQENYSSEYHKLCKLFLDYLQRYIYNLGIGHDLENEKVKQIENLVLMDQVTFRDTYYKKIKSKIINRSKLRVNNYLIFQGYALIDKVNQVVNKEELKRINNSLLIEVNELINEVAFQEIFVNGDLNFLESNQRGIFSILLLYYLGHFVYNKLNQEECISLDIVQKLELFIVYNFSNDYILSDEQLKIYEKVKESVSLRLSDYIITRSQEIKKHLHDFDEFNKFISSGKYRVIEESEELDFLPNIVNEEDLKIELEYFLMDVFMLEGNFTKVNLPIFQKSLEIEKHIAMELALEYMKRFVYRNQYSGNKMIYTLEEYIYTDDNFIVHDSSLCLIKSQLYSRVSKRNVKRVAKSNKLG